MENKIRDRYVSFQNIDCYENASMVLDAMNELFTLEPKSHNAFWVKFMEKIPENYKEIFEKDGYRDTLYQVCSNVFYIIDLFEHYEYDKGLALIDRCEFECC